MIAHGFKLNHLDSSVAPGLAKVDQREKNLEKAILKTSRNQRVDGMAVPFLRKSMLITITKQSLIKTLTMFKSNNNSDHGMEKLPGQ